MYCPHDFKRDLVKDDKVVDFSISAAFGFARSFGCSKRFSCVSMSVSLLAQKF